MLYLSIHRWRLIRLRLGVVSIGHYFCFILRHRRTNIYNIYLLVAVIFQTFRLHSSANLELFNFCPSIFVHLSSHIISLSMFPCASINTFGKIVLPNFTRLFHLKIFQCQHSARDRKLLPSGCSKAVVLS